MDTKKKVFEIAKKNNIVESSKKVWSKPVFEVISKDIIKSGTLLGGKESAAYNLHS